MRILAALLITVLGLSLLPSDSHAGVNSRNFTTFKVVIFGDGFTSGYGIDDDDSFPVMLRNRLNEEFVRERIEVVNASVSGDTSLTAVARLPSVLAEKGHIVVVALGGTDAVHKLDPNLTYRALDQILTVLTQNNHYVILAGFSAPADASLEYAARYNSMFPELAKRYRVTYLRDLMKDVTNEWPMLQFDQIHPNEDGSKQMADNIFEGISDMITKLRQRML